MCVLSWAGFYDEGMHTIIVPGGSTLVAPDVGEALQRRHLSTFDLPAGTLLHTPPPGSASLGKMNKGTGGGFTGSDRMDGVECYIPERSVITFADGAPAWVEIAGGSRLELPATWAAGWKEGGEGDSDGFYEVQVPLGACIMCPDEVNDEDNDGAAPLGAHDAFMNVFAETCKEDEGDEHFYVDATLTMEKRPRASPEAESGFSPKSAAAGSSPKNTRRKTLPLDSAARRAAMLSIRSQEPEQAGVACVTLRLPPRTRIASTVGTLNHLQVPSGCLFHFVGSSGSFLPPGATVALPSAPIKNHTARNNKPTRRLVVIVVSHSR